MRRRGEKTMKTYVICEDDEIHSAFLQKELDAYTMNKNVFVYTSGIELINNLKQFPKETIFLMDIVLSDHSGIDIAKKINECVENAVVIFISSFLEKATEVYEVEHCYFVYKPELKKRLPNALKRAEKIIEESKTMLQIKVKHKIRLLPIKDICYLERTKRTTMIYCIHETYECSEKFSELYEQLPSVFIQCHCSYIVNLNMVKEYRRTDFYLITNAIIPISRSFSKEVKTRFQEFILNHTNQKICTNK